MTNIFLPRFQRYHRLQPFPEIYKLLRFSHANINRQQLIPTFISGVYEPSPSKSNTPSYTSVAGEASPGIYRQL